MTNPIDIAIATFKRPAGLTKCLMALKDLTQKERLLNRVIVIDNDSQGGSRNLVTSLSQALPFNVTYINEKNQGISYARNVALEQSNAQYLAFIDDDEFPSPDWLYELMRTMEERRVDVVFGPSIPIAKNTIPFWAVSHPYFLDPRQRVQVADRLGATSNVLLRLSVIRKLDIKFSNAFAQTGGEDTDFFLRLTDNGASSCWSPEATVFEDVPDHRLSMRWLLKRSFSNGQTAARLTKPRSDQNRWLVRTFIKFIGAMTLSPIVLIALIVRPKCVGFVMAKYAGICGQVSTIFFPKLLAQPYGS